MSDQHYGPQKEMYQGNHIRIGPYWLTVYFTLINR